jgi:hypothetical protein
METKRIRFVDSVNTTLFFVEDGGEIELEVGADWIRCTCRYIDEYHFDLDGRVYHIAEFAQLRERLVQRYRPIKSETHKEVVCTFS